jgi:hypothetical protein
VCVCRSLFLSLSLSFSVFLLWIPFTRSTALSRLTVPVLASFGPMAAQAADSKRLALIAVLTGPNGSPRFDSLTKTKTVEVCSCLVACSDLANRNS